MAEPANPAQGTGTTGEPTKPTEPTADQKRIQALEAENKSLGENNKALQGNLNRARNREQASSKLTGQVASMQETLDVVLGAIGTLPELDETAKGRIANVGKGQTQRQQQEVYLHSQIDPIADILGPVGIESWEDPRVADVKEAIDDGDFLGAKRMARAYVKTTTGKPADITLQPKDEDKIKAEVDRQVRAAGVREVDIGKGKSTAPTGFTRDNLKEKLAGMSTKDILANLKAINEAGQA